MYVVEFGAHTSKHLCDFIIQYNPYAKNLNGLDKLTSVGGYVSILVPFLL
jgi:hypothetical protein